MKLCAAPQHPPGVTRTRRALSVFRCFSCVRHTFFINFLKKCKRFWEKTTSRFSVFRLYLHHEKMSWPCDDICRYILFIGTNGSYAWFFALHLKGLAWLCVWPDPKVIFFAWLFRILTGPGFCMRFILQNPGWVWGKWGPLWLLSGWVICGSYVGQIQANVPVDSAGHMPQPQFY